MTPEDTPPQPPAPTAAPARPAWLPPRIPFNGDWDTFIKALHIIFERDFVRVWPRFRALPVWHDNRKMDPDDKYNFEEGFWHLVTRNQRVYNRQKRCKETQRLPDTNRAGRLPWARPIINHDATADVTVWDFDEETPKGKVVRTYLWLKNHDYVVILERQKKDKGDVFMLITSFYSDYEGKRRDLQSRYERRRK